MRRLLPLLAIVTVSCATAKLAGRDVVAVTQAPAKQWKQVVAATAVVGAATLLDDEVAGTKIPLAGNLEGFGGGHSDKVMAAFLLAGIKNEKARNVAFDAIVSTTIASKGITPGIKQLVDRRRPNGGEQSFPSGHATQAFALASVIAAHYDQRWVDWLAYGIATGVGLARIDHNAHWTSDVLAGAAIGTFVGRTVVATNKRYRIVPVRNGVVVSVTLGERRRH